MTISHSLHQIHTLIECRVIDSLLSPDTRILQLFVKPKFIYLRRIIINKCGPVSLMIPGRGIYIGGTRYIFVPEQTYVHPVNQRHSCSVTRLLVSNIMPFPATGLHSSLGIVNYRELLLWLNPAEKSLVLCSKEKYLKETEDPCPWKP